MYRVYWSKYAIIDDENFEESFFSDYTKAHDFIAKLKRAFEVLGHSSPEHFIHSEKIKVN